MPVCGARIVVRAAALGRMTVSSLRDKTRLCEQRSFQRLAAARQDNQDWEQRARPSPQRGDLHE